jgi:uncharacterized damage-inducible protein DinB
MNADAIRYLYDYHFSENRRLWDEYVTSLSFEQFTLEDGYSHGSVREQIIHLMGVEEAWFSELRGLQPAEPLPPAGVDDRETIRACWDNIEQGMRDYLAKIRDEMLFEKPIAEPEEDKDLVTWQVLLQVINHGTDHRAQLLRQIHDLGIKTTAQDFIFYVYDHLLKG